MKISTYSDLIQEAKNWSGRPDIPESQYHSFTYFTGSIANQVLRIAPMEWTAIVDVNPDGTAVIPPDFQELKSITCVFNSETSVPLKRVSWDQFVNFYNNAEDRDTTSRWFSRQGGFWFLAPKPPVGSKITVHYFRTIPDISETEQTNWLIQVAPLVYLYGTLHFLYMYILDEERAKYWEDKMVAEVSRLQAMFDTAEYKGAQMVIQSPNTPGSTEYGV